jgi:hypothetical protein
MSPGVTLAGFGFALLAAFGAGYGAGAAVGPVGDKAETGQVEQRQHDMPAEEMTR